MKEWSREVLAHNLRENMEARNINQSELAKIAGVSPATVSDWLNAKKYPRIDKIEIIAKHFGIKKSDLIEDKSSQEEIKKNNEVLMDFAAWLGSDYALLEFVKKNHGNKRVPELVRRLCELDDAQLDSLERMLDAFLK